MMKGISKRTETKRDGRDRVTALRPCHLNKPPSVPVANSSVPFLNALFFLKASANDGAAVLHMCF